jgi:hypothetical protein
MSEEELLSIARRGKPFELRVRYPELKAKRRAETLEPGEYEELLRLTEEAEAFNVQWLAALTEFAHLRQATRSRHPQFQHVAVTPCFSAGGLPIPAHIIALDEAGLWKLPDDMTRFRELFSNADYGTPGALLHPLAHLKAVGRGRFWWEGMDDFFLGGPDPAVPPGDIDVENALDLGDMGLGADQPFALDYRVEDVFCPRVIFLSINKVDQDWENRWVTVASSVEEFTDLIGITTSGETQ